MKVFVGILFLAVCGSASLHEVKRHAHDERMIMSRALDGANEVSNGADDSDDSGGSSGLSGDNNNNDTASEAQKVLLEAGSPSADARVKAAGNEAEEVKKESAELLKNIKKAEKNKDNVSLRSAVDVAAEAKEVETKATTAQVEKNIAKEEKANESS